MPDRGARYADRSIVKVTRSLKKTYAQAQKELEGKLKDFNARFKAKDKEKRAQRDNGEITEQQYKDWLSGQVFIRNQWESKVRQVNAVMLDYNKQAMNIVNNSRFDVFAENYYSEAFRAQWIVNDLSWNVYNSQALAKLIKDDPQILPEWKIDEEKDYKWNYKKVNNIIKQGIIQGESVEQITKRLCTDLSSMNENKMRMFARTGITEAQNAGRQEQMRQAAEELDIEQEKEWQATYDNRTRDAHRHLDGQRVPWNETFQSDLGEIRYPGDPTADPANVYNCRCTMKTIYPKYEDRSKNFREDVTIDGQSYEEWKENVKYPKRITNASDSEQRKEKIEMSYNAPIITKMQNKYGIISNEEKDTYIVDTSGSLNDAVKKIELGELFNESQAIAIAETIETLHNEYPLANPLMFVGDVRIEQNLPRDVDILDMQYEYPAYSGFGARYVHTHEGDKIWIADERLNTETLKAEFEMRHALRLKYMDENGMLSEKNAFELVSDTVEGTLRHEWCHGLQWDYVVTKDSKEDCYNELDEYLQANKDKVMQMSKYATDHPYEMLSEAFVQKEDKEHPDTIATKTANEVWAIFEKYMRKGMEQK